MGSTESTESRVDWAALAIALVVLAVVVSLGTLGYRSVADNRALTEHYNTSVVECVQAGGEPLTCREAFRARSR